MAAPAPVRARGGRSFSVEPNMPTMSELIEFIDEEISRRHVRVSKACINAVLDSSDADACRDAALQAAGLQAIEQLREDLAALAKTSQPRKKRRKGGA